MEKLKIGDFIYKYDFNRRFYDENNRVIYSRSFTQHEIVDETKQSFILYNGDKVDKTTLKIKNPGYGFYQCFTEQGKEDEIFIHDNLYKIIEKIKSIGVNEADKLRAINNML